MHVSHYKVNCITGLTQLQGAYKYNLKMITLSIIKSLIYSQLYSCTITFCNTFVYFQNQSKVVGQ